MYISSLNLAIEDPEHPTFFAVGFRKKMVLNVFPSKNFNEFFFKKNNSNFKSICYDL